MSTIVNRNASSNPRAQVNCLKVMGLKVSL